VSRITDTGPGKDDYPSGLQSFSLSHMGDIVDGSGETRQRQRPYVRGLGLQHIKLPAGCPWCNGAGTTYHGADHARHRKCQKPPANPYCTEAAAIFPARIPGRSIKH